MKTKWQVWAHLLCTNYSFTALKKIIKWLRNKDIIDLVWIDVYVDNSYKGEKRDMAYFMAWYKDNSSNCATYSRLATQIETIYGYEMSEFHRTIAYKIRRKYENNDLDVAIPF